MTAPTGKAYPINTLQQMAEVPEDRWPAMLEEMPEMLRQLRYAGRRVTELTAGVPRWKRWLLRVKPRSYIAWIDDGKFAATIRLDERELGGELTVYYSPDHRKERWEGEENG